MRSLADQRPDATRSVGPERRIRLTRSPIAPHVQHVEQSVGSDNQLLLAFRFVAAVLLALCADPWYMALFIIMWDCVTHDGPGFTPCLHRDGIYRPPLELDRVLEGIDRSPRE